MKNLIESWEEWEKNFLLNERGEWDTPSGLPCFTDKIYNKYCELQELRNKVKEQLRRNDTKKDNEK